MQSLKSIINAKLLAIKSGDINSFKSAEKEELDFLVDVEMYKFISDSDNAIVKKELSHQKLCRTLELEGVQIKGLTVLEFNSAIDLITDKYKKKNKRKN